MLVIFQSYWAFHLLSTILGVVCGGSSAGVHVGDPECSVEVITEEEQDK